MKFKPLKLNQENLKELFIFAAIFTGLSSVLHFLIWLNFNTVPLQQVTASITSQILVWFGLPAYSSNIDVIISNFGIIRLIRACLGWKSMLAFSALVIATRKRSKNSKMIGLLVGNIAIIILNFVRLTTTFLLIYYLNWDFEVVHTFLWQWSLVFIILFFWVFWYKTSH